MPRDQARNIQHCTLPFFIDKVELKQKGEFQVVLRYHRPEEGEEHSIAELIALQRTGSVAVTFQAVQQSLELDGEE